VEVGVGNLGWVGIVRNICGSFLFMRRGQYLAALL